ncbi:MULTISPECIES: hypothetical protein [unclassified Oleiphilus]|nr:MULTISPECIES: hypothetical protein [unclassified Oleiphilus]
MYFYGVETLKEAEEFEPLPRDEYDKLFQAPKEPDSSKDLQSNTQNDKPKQS